MKLLIVLLALVALCGCDQLARFTHVPSTPERVAPVSPRSAAKGEPGSVSTSGWGLPPADGRGYAIYTHDPAVNNGCSEWDVEPAAEIDNDGELCKSVVP